MKHSPLKTQRALFVLSISSKVKVTERPYYMTLYGEYGTYGQLRDLRAKYDKIKINEANNRLYGGQGQK